MDETYIKVKGKYGATIDFLIEQKDFLRKRLSNMESLIKLILIGVWSQESATREP